MEVDGLVWVVLKAESRDGLALRDVRIREAQELEDDLGPILPIVRVRHRLELGLLFWLERQAVGTRPAAGPHSALLNRLLDEIGRIQIVHLAEGNDLAHRCVVPVSEGPDDVWDVASLDRLEVWHVLGEMIDGVLVVGDEFWVLDLAQLRDARSPEEKRQDVLAAIPALSVLIRADIPLPGQRHQVLEAQVPLDDQLGDLGAELSFALSIDAHGLDDVAELQPFSDVLPDLVGRLLGLVND